jgi:hypothetical protein
MTITTCTAYSARLAALAVLASALFAGAALAAVRTGTDGSETLVGTTKNDQITGKGGNDTLIGKAGNDRYVFADTWGTDTLVEKVGEGSDTVDFHAVTTGPVKVAMIPEWVDVVPLYNVATGPGGDIRFAFEVNGQTIQSIVENAIGGQGDGDIIQGGAGRNVLQPGGGAHDVLLDGGGYDDGPDGNPELPVSNDVFKGFAGNTGTDFIQDWGGTGDVLDMRPFALGDVVIDPIDLDDDGPEESLQIVTSLFGQVVIPGQFGEFSNYESMFNHHGQIETIRFADTTFSSTSALQSMTVASTAARSGKQARLAEAAEGLAKEARALVDTNDPLGLLRGSGDQRNQGGADTSRAKTPHRDGKHRKHEH